MSEVFLCRTGALKPASKRELKAAGIVVVEVENPADCQFIRASEVVSSSDMLWAACDALRRTYKASGYTAGEEISGNHRQQFALNLFELVEAAHNAAKPEGAS